MKFDCIAKDWEVVVIGAGPAGAFAALLLAHSGVRVLLIEKENFPREKVCGGCLNYGAITLLQSYGLGQVISKSDATALNQFTVQTRYAKGKLKIGGGVAVSRSIFDSELVAMAISAGVIFLDDVSGYVQDSVNESRSILLRSKGSELIVNAKIVIVACGLNNRALPELGAPEVVVDRDSRIGVGTILNDAALCERGNISMLVSSRGYVGMTRLAGDQIDLAAALDLKAIKKVGGVAQLINSIRKECKESAIPEISNADWRGTPTLSRRVEIPATTRIFLVGDAAGYVEPFTGEGINWALSAAALVVPIVKQALRQWSSSLITKWADTYRNEIAIKQRVCRSVSQIMRYPILITPALFAMNRISFAYQPLLKRMHHSPIEHSDRAVAV